MNLQQQNDTSPLETTAPIFLLLSGLIFCIVVKSVELVFQALGDAVIANYLISKPYYAVNYFWLCEVLFTGFICLGLLSLIRGKGKACSSILIISCLAIAANTAVLKATMKKGHMQRIRGLEAALERAQTEAASEPYLSDVMSIHRGRYTELVDRWNELHKNRYEPAAGLALSDVERAKVIRDLLYLDSDALPNTEWIKLGSQLLNPWRSISNQCSFIFAAVHQLTEATNSPCIVIKQQKLWKLDDRNEFKFSSGGGPIPVGANGWFLYVGHSHWSADNVGDLSIGRDHTGNYYFTHSHTCGGLKFWIGPSKAYVSMQDFLARNTSWHLIPNIDEWKSASSFVDPVSER